MYQIQKSTRANKKYMVIFDTKIVHFGDSRYQHYKDTTPLKLYSNLDHLDQERRRLFYARHKGNKIYSAIWFSKKYLW